jgi:hypothetical protein
VYCTVIVVCYPYASFAHLVMPLSIRVTCAPPRVLILREFSIENIQMLNKLQALNVHHCICVCVLYVIQSCHLARRDTHPHCINCYLPNTTISLFISFVEEIIGVGGAPLPGTVAPTGDLSHDVESDIGESGEHLVHGEVSTSQLAAIDDDKDDEEEGSVTGEDGDDDEGGGRPVKRARNEGTSVPTKTKKAELKESSRKKQAAIAMTLNEYKKLCTIVQDLFVQATSPPKGTLLQICMLLSL